MDIKEQYNSPVTEVVEIKTEGIICTSNPTGTGSGFTWD